MPTDVEVEFVTFTPDWDESEAHAKKRIAELIRDGYTIAAAAGGGDGIRIDNHFRQFVTVILQRKPTDSS